MQKIGWTLNINIEWKIMMIFLLNDAKLFIYIGPESDHCLPLSVTDSLTHWLTDCCLVNLIDVTLPCEDAKRKLVDAVTL